METVSSIFILAAMILLCYLLIKVLSAPLRKLIKLMINTGMGFIALFIINFFGEFIGFTIGINVINAAIVGIFGMPGVILLVLLKIFF